MAAERGPLVSGRRCFADRELAADGADLSRRFYTNAEVVVAEDARDGEEEVFFKPSDGRLDAYGFRRKAWRTVVPTLHLARGRLHLGQNSHAATSAFFARIRRRPLIPCEKEDCLSDIAAPPETLLPMTVRSWRESMAVAADLPKTTTRSCNAASAASRLRLALATPFLDVFAASDSFISESPRSDPLIRREIFRISQFRVRIPKFPLPIYASSLHLFMSISVYSVRLLGAARIFFAVDPPNGHEFSVRNV